ncbi:heavy-metal-associated domain-containing protein [Halobiforma nitratireducens]|uniref:Heavy metal transport/detoxification protein n=1 Tax=Halobiforma nitratireducens JCM 10879 TaxID=1227454 RepID=M0MBD7_9EURY|nr:heavy metal-associated domain-containing protein [Halobiforma nitratireducens]EMA41720.1 Heavy metal transport/detoxification protein [Halobiforma nitratireducens JCM 10879]
MTQLVEYRVTDFECPTCANNLERALERTDGVERADVHYTTGRVELEYDAGTADRESFERTISNQGYTPRPR